MKTEGHADPLHEVILTYRIRKDLTQKIQEIKSSNSTSGIHLSTERAEGFIDGLESAHALDPEQIFKVRQIIESTAQARTMILIL
ncbi:hypothetical protein [Pseudomonas helleri]|uniref:hypothetical protein n=1 Tax=Pseudomonas helleri TaxID=1608996 RepID=UPI0024316D54|nr:hypothetical protein [Pseudomonas helleri]